VYTPLFAPIAVPMIVGLLKEMLGWWRRRKGKKTSAEAKKVLQEDEILEGEETEKENKEEGELDQGEAAMTAASDASENGPQEVSVLRSRRIAANVDG
jgi:hypothetical protein